MGRRSAGKHRPATPDPTPAAEARLDELYAQVPDMLDCKGLCYDSCTAIALSPVEHDRILRESGIDIPSHEAPVRDEADWARRAAFRCPALTPAGRCAVYRIRPMLCRTFGTAQDSTCEHGCQPVTWLTAVQARRLLAEAWTAGGNPDRGAAEHQLADALESDPVMQARHAKFTADHLARYEAARRRNASP